jgi:hypothetical protein
MSVVDAIAWAIIVVAIGNLYFLIGAYRIYRSVLPPSPLLFALLGVGAVVWLVGMWVALMSARYVADLPPLPLGGVGLGLGLLALMGLPAFIWWQVRKFISSDADRNLVRDAARDSGRDEIRDEARDIARDAERDLGQ